MSRNLEDRIRKAVKYGPDMTKPTRLANGGYTLPAEGIAHARLVGYFEIGQHEEESRKKKKARRERVIREKVDLIFELSGPNHPPHDIDGMKIPRRITLRETLDLGEDAEFFKLFGAMNYAGKARHMAQLLGQSFLVEVFHYTSKTDQRTYAVLKGPNGYNIKGPLYQDPHSGEIISVKVDPVVTAIKLFAWKTAENGDWDDIYIEGFWDEEKDAEGNVIKPKQSKNVFQERIMRATNWPELAARLGL